MNETMVAAMIAAAALIGLVVVALAGLRAWHEWVELQRFVADGHRAPDRTTGSTPAARIELADLRERVRKLEAIAAGVDL